MAVGLIVGGWFASTVITKLINGLIDYAKDQKKMQLGLQDELKRLEKSLPKIQAVVDAVDHGLIREKNTPLEKWLWQLRDAGDQADDVMDEMEYNFVKEKAEAGEKSTASKSVSNFKTFLRRAVNKDPALKKLRKAVKVIDEVAKGVGEFFIVVQRLEKKHESTINRVMKTRQTDSHLNMDIFGREKEEKHTIQKLLNPVRKDQRTNFAILPIIGAGGVGKTTLAQHVYNDPEVKKNFELRMWVCISNNFDVMLLTRKLYESVFHQKADFENFDTITTELIEKLKTKRFLVVFDDAWNDDRSEWEKLFNPLKYGKSGSMILLTTRIETVASNTGPNLMDPVYLEGLNESDLRKLFEQYAFGGQDPKDHNELVEIGRDIVKKLKGSPLAAKTVGGILCSNLSREHWESILESELWSLKQGDHDIMPALSLTYQHLPSHLKPCFTFCSIFPQDHVFMKDDLIYMWLALGLVPRVSNGSKRAEDVGSEYFEEMLNRSIFSQANPVSNAHLCYPAYTYCSTAEKQFVGGFVLHDLMHDLSSFVSQGECFRSETNRLVDIPETVRHLYIRVGDCRELSNLKFQNIRTLILQVDDSNPPELVCILNTMLKGMTSLRLLTLLSLGLSEIPDSVTDLLHLRYLSLSSFMLGEFPPSMSRLHHLETMVCGGFGFINQANVLGKLISLRHIIASESFVDAIACKGRLTALQELSFRVDKKSGFEISELSNMRELRRLTISNINDVGNHGQAKQGNLRSKVGLRELSLQWETTEFDEQVFDHLQPNSNLKELRIINYMGSRLPSWEIGSLSSLVKLEISDCHNLVSLGEQVLQNPDNKVVALKDLIISNCKGLEMPEKGFSEFISLKRLDISGCPNIKPFSVLVLFPPSKLQFLRIDSYVQDGVGKKFDVKNIMADLIDEINLCELSMQQAPTLQTQEAKLLVLEHPGKSSNSEVTLMRMRDYMGTWPPVWLIQTLSTLEFLCIDGRPISRTYHSKELPDRMNQLEDIIIQHENVRCDYPSLEMLYPSDKPVPEKVYLAMQHIKGMQYCKKLTIAVCSKSCVMPSLPVTLKKLKLHHLALKDLENLFDNQSRESGSLSSLVCMEISDLLGLVSLAGVLFQKPQLFAALEKLTIRRCTELMYLPQGGFNEFVSLKELVIIYCPKIEVQWGQQCFLPSALEVLEIASWYNLDAILPKALESVNSLMSLELVFCDITSLPPKEVFIRWKTLEKLEISDCPELTSLEGLVGLCSMKLFIVNGCRKLVSEIEKIVEEGTMQNSSRPNLTELTPKNSTEADEKPQLSVDELEIDDPLLLSIEPINSISALKKLTIRDCSKLQSLPELPPVLEELSLYGCCPELQRRCENSGEDWPKLSHIPNVSISRFWS